MVSARSYWRSSAPIVFLALAACASAKTDVALRAASAAPTNLESTIRARLDSIAAHTSFYARQLSTGREVDIRADDPMNTASVIKIPVMVMAYQMIMKGLWGPIHIVPTVTETEPLIRPRLLWDLIQLRAIVIRTEFLTGANCS